jgi:hypothetical protein
MPREYEQLDEHADEWSRFHRHALDRQKTCVLCAVCLVVAAWISAIVLFMYT